MVLNRPSGTTADPARPATSARDPFGAVAVRERLRASARTVARDGAYECTFRALGTSCRVVAAGPAPAATAYLNAALDWVAAFEAKYSRFLPDSLIGRINAAAGRAWVELDPEADRLLQLCQESNFLSRGILDPTALPLIQLWNWKQVRTTLPSDAEIEQARALVGWRKIQRAPGRIFLPEPGMCLDLGGMGKEFAVDQVVQLARAFGIGSALVDFGADVRVTGLPADGRPGWHIGLENPAAPGTCWCGLAVREAAVATSGDYIRRFELGGRRYGHILDVRTGRPVAHGVRAVSVLAPSCTQAGMFSTALFVLGPEEGLRWLDAAQGVAGALVTDTGIHRSRKFHEHVVT